jgi:hypothetical protein
LKFRRVSLRAPEPRLTELQEFYAQLGTGETELEFVAGEGNPFYHFAFLAPPARFDELLAATAEPLPDPDTGDVVFDFEDWEAKAFYFHDPAGNIVEVVAHTGLEEEGLSELGLVGDPSAMAEALHSLGLELWDGTLEEEGRLAFLGERGHTLILAPRGRGWMPTGRPAEPYPVEAELDGPPTGEVELEGGLYRISRR